MRITEQKEADEYFELLVKLCMHDLEDHRTNRRALCERIQRENLAYFAGYYGAETRARVERLFKCEHPVFGSIEKNGPPSAEKAFALGQLFGALARQNKEPKNQ